jgi:hypothetical protein
VDYFLRDLKRTDRWAAITQDKLTRAAWQPVREALTRIAGSLMTACGASAYDARLPGKSRSPSALPGSGKDLLVVAVQRCGRTFRRAREAVDAIVGIWESNLIERRPVETPLGWVGTRPAPHPRQRIRFAKMCVLFLDPRRVWLTKKRKVLFAPLPE